MVADQACMRQIPLLGTQRSLVSDALSGGHDALLDTDAQIASSVDLDVELAADDASENVANSVELDGFNNGASAILSDSVNAMDGNVPETNVNDSGNVFDSDVSSKTTSNDDVVDESLDMMQANAQTAGSNVGRD